MLIDFPYFNPRTREGCDYFADIDAAAAAEISIHAPARGATKRIVWTAWESTDISIHAPARGAT